MSNDITTCVSAILMNLDPDEASDNENNEPGDELTLQDVVNSMWNRMHPGITRDELSRQVCLERAIKNSPEFYEARISWRKITFGRKFPIYCRGKINDEYVVYRIYIHAALDNNLSGPHLISIEDHEPFWVHSLTALRKKFFKFEDFVSFERSSFITIHNGVSDLIAVRIKMIRQNILLPTNIIPSRVYTSRTHYYMYTNHTVEKVNTHNLSPRSEQQIKRMMFNIKQIYFRDGVEIPSFLQLN